MRFPTFTRSARLVLWVLAVALATILVLLGVTWVSLSWIDDATFSHGARLAVALSVAAAVVQSLFRECEQYDASPDKQHG